MQACQIKLYLASFFQFDASETTYRTEILAGITTFATLAYALVVTPSILFSAIFLQQPGDLFDELVIATAIVSALSTLLLSLWTKHPFALAPGMGLNSLFAISSELFDFTSQLQTAFRPPDESG